MTPMDHPDPGRPRPSGAVLPGDGAASGVPRHHAAGRGSGDREGAVRADAGGRLGGGRLRDVGAGNAGGGGRRARLLAGHVTALILGILLLALALPRLAAALVELPGDRVLQTLRAGVSVTDAALDAAAGTRVQSLRLIEAADARRELGALLHTRAVRERDAPAARAPAERALADGLARAPLDPFAWTRLATLVTLDARPADALAAVRASYRSAPWEPALSVLRLRLVLAHWPAAGDLERRILVTEARHLWHDDPQALAALAAEHPRARRLLRAALEEEGEDLGAGRAAER